MWKTRSVGNLSKEEESGKADSKVRMVDRTFITKTGTFLHLMEVRIPNFTRLRTKGVLVNRLLWHRSQRRPEVVNNMEGIKFVGLPRVTFPTGSQMNDVVESFITDEHMRPIGESREMIKYYKSILVSMISQAGWILNTIEDIKRYCCKRELKLDISPQYKFKILVNVIRLREQGIIKGSTKTGNLP